MFRLVSFVTTILACTQYALGSNLHSALHAPSTTSVISSGHGSGYGHHGHPVLANSAIHSRNHGLPTHSVISSYSSTVIHPNSPVLHPILSNSIPSGHHGQNRQYISAPSSLAHQIYSTPLVSGGRGHGHSGSHANAYAVQRSYTGPLAASGYPAPHGLNSASIVLSGYGAQLGQAHQTGISGHLSRW